MAIELTAESGPVFLEFQVHGLLTTDDLTQIVNHVDGHEIQKISIEIATETPAILHPPSVEPKKPAQLAEDDDIENPEGTTDTPSDQSASDEGEYQKANPTAETPQHNPRLQPHGDPFAIMRVVAHHDGWLRTKEVADAIPTEWDVSGDALGTNLWNLEDRGLVEKRPYEDDKRQNEYRITEIGGRVIEDAVERTDNPPPLQ